MQTPTSMTADAVANPRPMPGWLKNCLLAACVFVICWGGAIAYWRASGSNPTTTELALYLLGLPCGVLALFLIGRECIARRMAVPATAAPAATVRLAGQGSTETQAATLVILDTALRCLHGISADDLADTIANNKARADLDPELTDDDGFPVMSVRSDQANNDLARAEIAEWFAQSGSAELEFVDEQWRALILASAVVGDLMAQVLNDAQSSNSVTSILQLAPLLPAEWTADQRRVAGMWFKHLAVESGWPAERIRLVEDSLLQGPGMSPKTIIDDLARTHAATDAATITMLLACASHIGSATVDRWAADGTLFTSSNPQGRIPGEGAAGLLLSNPKHASANGTEGAALLESMEELQRDSAAQEAKRIDSILLDELAQRIQKRTGFDVADVAMVVADTDHRNTLELMKHVTATMPQLDGIDDVARLGVACGTCGIVPFVTALALARHYALKNQAPVLCIGNDDPRRRIAILVKPLQVLN